MRENSFAAKSCLLSLCLFVILTQIFSQSITISAGGPQAISSSSTTVSSTSSSNSGIASVKWTKYTVPGQTAKKVIVVGSSTAAGNGATNGNNAFVNRLRSYYQSEGIASDFVNLAVAGTSPFDININNVLDQYPGDILLVSYPSNGYTASNNGNVINRLNEFQNACNSRNMQMFVTGTQPRNDFNDADRANLITMNNLMRNNFGDRYMDFLTPLLNTNGNIMKAEYYADGIHPNDAGHNVLFELVKGANIFRNSISSSSNITSPSSASTGITGLAQGVHRFQVSVIDNGGFAGSAVTSITVTGGGNSPVANAGPAQNILLPTSQVTLSGSGAAGNGGTVTYSWTRVSGPNNSPQLNIVSPTSPSTVVTGLIQGSYIFRLTVTQSGDNQTASSDVAINVNAAANLKNIPGKIEAESWDAKSGPFYAVATNDAGGGQQVVGIANGSWMDYNVSVAQTGNYTVNFRVATTQLHAQFQLKLGNTVLGTVNIPNTGDWNTWQTIPMSNVALTAGTQILRIISTSTENCNLNWVEFVLAGGATPPPTANAGTTQTITLPTSQVTLAGSGTANNGGSVIEHTWSKFSGGAANITDPSNYNTTVTGLAAGTYVFRLSVKQNDNQTATSDVTIIVNPAVASGPTPYSGTRKSIPGKLEAEEYDLGGQNVAYTDGTASNLGGAFRTAEAVDVRTCPDAGGGYAIGWTTDGEWIKYSVNVTTSGIYDFAVRAGTPNSGKSVQLQVDDVAAGTLTVVNTGGFNNWQTSTLSNISLTAGDHTFRFFINTGNVSNPDFGFDINWFSFTLASASPAPGANAGVTQTITLPTNQITLAGSGTANNGGSIIEHTWSKFSGGAATITDPSNYNTTVTGLAAGTYVFRLIVKQNDNQTATSDVTITVNPANPSGSTPYGGTRKSIPGKLEAEEYDLGGQNVAYNDGTASNLGGAFRTAEAVDVRTCPDAGGGYAIGWTTDGEWMKYSVNVTTSGAYDFAVRAGTPNTGKSVQLEVDDVTVGTLTVINTGGFNTWQTSTLSKISLTAGDHIFRFLINTGNPTNPDFGFDINWFSFTLASAPSPTANAGATQTITLPTSQVTLAGSGTANNGGSIIEHTWSKFSGGAANITDPLNYNTTVTGLAAGTYVFRLTVKQNDNQTATSDVTITVNPAVVSGKNIPGRIEAESWDAKSGPFYATATVDAGGGQQVVGIANGSFMDYNVNVTQSGNYTVGFRIATTKNNAQFQIKSGTTVLGTINIPNTGDWNNWVTASISNIALTAGTQTIRILSTNNENCNFNWMDFSLAAPRGINPITVQQTGGENFLQTKVEVFPNPGTDHFTLKLNDTREGKMTIQIFDQTGKLQKSIQSFKNKGSFQYPVSIADLPQGVYMLRVKVGIWSETLKVSKF